MAKLNYALMSVMRFTNSSIELQSIKSSLQNRLSNFQWLILAMSTVNNVTVLYWAIPVLCVIIFLREREQLLKIRTILRVTGEGERGNMIVNAFFVHTSANSTVHAWGRNCWLSCRGFVVVNGEERAVVMSRVRGTNTGPDRSSWTTARCTFMALNQNTRGLGRKQPWGNSFHSSRFLNVIPLKESKAVIIRPH